MVKNEIITCDRCGSKDSKKYYELRLKWQMGDSITEDICKECKKAYLKWFADKKS